MTAIAEAELSGLTSKPGNGATLLIPEELMQKMQKDGLLMLDTRSKTSTNKKIYNHDIGSPDREARSM